MLFHSLLRFYYRLARPLFDDFKLKWGYDSYIQAKPSDSIYPASSALDITQYVEHGALLLESDYDIPGSVQYAPRRDGDREEEDFRSFFGGNLFRDKRVGSSSIAYRVTPSSSSSLMRDSTRDSSGFESRDETNDSIETGNKIVRRQSW